MFLTLAIFGLGIYDCRGETATSLVPILMGMALVALMLFVVGLGLLMRSRELAAGDALPEVDYSHTHRLLVVVSLGIALFGVVRWLAVPSSFGQYGHYRGLAIATARGIEPRHLGERACVKCHAKIAKLHDKDAHSTNPCESCHGPGWQHAKNPKKNKMVRPAGRTVCLVCHERLQARPMSFPQIDVQSHFKLVGVKYQGVKCIQCHSPHEPLFMDRDIRKARLHPVVHRCKDCHRGRTNEFLEKPPHHPPIFECSYCHKALVADFQKRKHRKLECTTCHLFFKQTEFSGRIIRDADPRFCLLCHRKTKFRSKSGPPTIDWAKHKKEQADGEDTKCIECHRDRIHGDKPSAPKSATPPAMTPEAGMGAGSEPASEGKGMAPGMGAPVAKARPAAAPVKRAMGPAGMGAIKKPATAPMVREAVAP